MIYSLYGPSTRSARKRRHGLPGELQTQVLVKCSDNPWGTRLALKTLPVAPSFDLKVAETGAASAETRLLAMLFFGTCWQDWSMYAVIKSGVLSPRLSTFSLHCSVSRSVSSFPPRRRMVLVLFSLLGLFISLDTVSSFSTHFAEKLGFQPSVWVNWFSFCRESTFSLPIHLSSDSHLC